MKYELTVITIFAIAVLMGMANDSETEFVRKSDSVHAVPDTLTFSELKEQIAAVFPDTAAVPDSLLFKKFSDICNGLGYNMPVLLPDDELTSSMPQMKPEDVDPGILIPGFAECIKGLKERKNRH
jgi:hypothetical protein